MSLVDLEAEWVRWDLPVVPRDLVVETTPGTWIRVRLKS